MAFWPYLFCSISKSLKLRGFTIKRLLSCKFNFDTVCVELKFSYGMMIAVPSIVCISLRVTSLVQLSFRRLEIRNNLLDRFNCLIERFYCFFHCLVSVRSFKRLWNVVNCLLFFISYRLNSILNFF